VLFQVYIRLGANLKPLPSVRQTFLSSVSLGPAANALHIASERIGKTSRDVYDVWVFLKNRFPINKEIVEARSGMPFEKLIEMYIHQLEKLDNRKIIDGVGEFLTASQKDWAKAKLRQETLALLTLRYES
jgi:hypothetical protein